LFLFLVSMLTAISVFLFDIPDTSCSALQLVPLTFQLQSLYHRTVSVASVVIWSVCYS
jgi:hypothetical protein